jgi:hypothetical protein
VDKRTDRWAIRAVSCEVLIAEAAAICKLLTEKFERLHQSSNAMVGHGGRSA